MAEIALTAFLFKSILTAHRRARCTSFVISSRKSLELQRYTCSTAVSKADIIDIRPYSVDQHHGCCDFTFGNGFNQIFIQFNVPNHGFAASCPHADAQAYVVCNLVTSLVSLRLKTFESFFIIVW
jgi:hypothetical protein